MNCADITSKISAELVLMLAAGSQRPLTDGAILLGPEHISEGSAAPRIVFVPIGSRYEAPIAYGAANRKSAANQRPLWTDAVRFEAHVWGASTTPDADYTATETLFEYLVNAINNVTPGNYALIDAAWTDARIVRSGRELVFGLEINTPVATVSVSDTIPAPATMQAAVKLNNPAIDTENVT